MSAFRRANAKLKRAKDVQVRSRQKEQDIDDELKRLEECAKWLRTLRKLNRGQHNAWLSGTLARSIVPYCQTWNLQFAEEMQDHLPVELRNMVYQFLWDSDTFAAFPDLTKVAGGSRSVDDGRSALTLPHFIDPKFIGLTTARKIVRALYDAFYMTGPMITIQRPEHITAAVTKDVFGVGIDPFVHLRSLKVRIDVDRLRTSRPKHKLSSTCQHTVADKVYTKQNELREWLKALLYFKHKSKFQIFVDLYQHNIRIAVVEEVLDVIAEVRGAMKARGAAFFVDWTYRDEGWGTQWEDLITFEVEDFFVLPRMIWKLRMGKYLFEAAEEEIIHQRHVRFINEPCQHVTDSNFVHRMWDDDEDEGTTDGSQSDEDLDDESDEDSDLDSDEEVEQNSDLYKRTATSILLITTASA